MSNHMHLECWSHEPHIVDDSWVGQHDEDLPAIRLALSDRIVSGPASFEPGAWGEAQNLAAFIHRHLTCDIRVVDEAGNDRTASPKIEMPDDMAIIRAIEDLQRRVHDLEHPKDVKADPGHASPDWFTVDPPQSPADQERWVLAPGTTITFNTAEGTVMGEPLPATEITKDYDQQGRLRTITVTVGEVRP